MEDLDWERVRPGLDDAALADLEWLGLDWNGAVVRQSQRSALYRAAIGRLDARGDLYPCVCSRREIASAQSAPHAEDSTRPYPGTCRDRFRSAAEAQASSGRSPALRFMPPSGLTRFTDGVAGPTVEDLARSVGDFPVARRDGEPAYQLAVVVDDADQGVSEVLRGDDLLASTARQIVLQHALGLPAPVWFHVPLVLDATGRRIAKRADDLSLARLREAGVDPRQVVGWAAASAGQVGPGRGTATEYLAHFDLARVPAEPLRLAPDPLAAFGEK